MEAYVSAEQFHRMVHLKIGDKIDLCLYTEDMLNPRKAYEILEFIGNMNIGFTGIVVISENGNIVTLRR
jgi:hypothetical protein